MRLNIWSDMLTKTLFSAFVSFRMGKCMAALWFFYHRLWRELRRHLGTPTVFCSSQLWKYLDGIGYSFTKSPNIKYSHPSQALRADMIRTFLLLLGHTFWLLYEKANNRVFNPLGMSAGTGSRNTDITQTRKKLKPVTPDLKSKSFSSSC